MVAYVGCGYLTSGSLDEFKTGATVPTPGAGAGTLEQFVRVKAAVFWAEGPGPQKQGQLERRPPFSSSAHPPSWRDSLVEMNSFGFVLGGKRGIFRKSAQ